MTKGSQIQGSEDPGLMMVGDLGVGQPDDKKVIAIGTQYTKDKILLEIDNLETEIELRYDEYLVMARALESQGAGMKHEKEPLKIRMARWLVDKPMVESKANTRLTDEERELLTIQANKLLQNINNIIARRDALKKILEPKDRAEIDGREKLTLIIGGIKKRANAVSETKLTKEQAELLKNLEAQYPIMKASLERRNISTEGLPTWERVKKGLTPEVLTKVLKHKEPALLLIPPTTRQSKLEAVNKNAAKKHKYDIYTNELKDNNLWNGGKSQTENKWRVSIVEGVQDVPQDNTIYDGKRTNYEMTKLWVEKYQKEGMDVMNDADEYLVLMMKRIDEGKPVDSCTNTVLNGSNLTKTSLVAGGFWFFDEVRMSRISPDVVSSFIRLRGSVEIDVGVA
jgi:hypothetical protein